MLSIVAPIVTNFWFTIVGGSGIAIGSRCNGCALIDSRVHDVAGNGVLVGEDRGRAVAGRPWWQSAPQQVATGNVVRGNVIEHCGRLFYGAVGVWVGFAADTRIEGNTIRRLPYTGVSVGWMWSPTPTPGGSTTGTSTESRRAWTWSGRSIHFPRAARFSASCTSGTVRRGRSSVRWRRTW